MHNLLPLSLITVPLVILSSVAWFLTVALTGLVGFPPWLASLAGFFVSLMVGIILSLSLMTYFHDYRNGSANVGQALKQGFGGFAGLIEARLVGIVLTGLGFLCFIVPGILYSVRFLFVEALRVIAPEERGHLPWNHYSHNLMKGYGFSVFGTISVLLLLIWFTAMLMLTPFSMMMPAMVSNPTDAIGFLILILIVMFILECVSIVAIAGMVYLLAVELKAIKGDEIGEMPGGITLLTKITLVGATLVAITLFSIGT